VNLDLYIKEIFIQTNEDLSNEIESNIIYSGSTCNCVFYTPSKLICANIGDSRAVLGRFSEGGIKLITKNQFNMLKD